MSSSLPIFVASLMLLSGCTKEQQNAAVEISRQAMVNSGEYVTQPAADSVFPTNGVKWYPLEIGNGKPFVTNGKRTWRVELRGWLSAVGTGCNTDDPDWHYLLEIDPDWADAAGMPVAQLLRAGNMVAHVTGEQVGDANARRIVGIPNVNVELNGYVPAQHGGQAAPASWGTFGKDCTHNNETASWAFDPSRPLSWQDPLDVGKYVRMYGALVTDGPHTEQGYPAEFFCRQFTISAACKIDGTQQRLALIRWAGNRDDDDASNPSRWTEMHPPDIIAILPDKPHTTNMRSVAVSAENCLIGPCEKTTLDVDIDAPQPKPPDATTVAFREEVIPATNFQTIKEGHQNGSGGFDGADVSTTATGIHVHVAVQGQSGYGPHGRFGAFYRVSWSH